MIFALEFLLFFATTVTTESFRFWQRYFEAECHLNPKVLYVQENNFYQFFLKRTQTSSFSVCFRSTMETSLKHLFQWMVVRCYILSVTIEFSLVLPLGFHIFGVYSNLKPGAVSFIRCAYPAFISCLMLSWIFVSLIFTSVWLLMYGLFIISLIQCIFIRTIMRK